MLSSDNSVVDGWIDNKKNNKTTDICSMCTDTFKIEQLIYCMNVYFEDIPDYDKEKNKEENIMEIENDNDDKKMDKEKLKNEEKMEIEDEKMKIEEDKKKEQSKKLIHCNNVICGKCFLINYMLDTISYQFNCPFCHQILNYDAVIRALKNCSDNISEYVKKCYPSLYNERIEKNAYNEFIRLFKDKILKYEQGNINNIDVEVDLFKKYIDIKKDDIKCFSTRDELFNANVSIADYNNIINNIHSNIIYYNNWKEIDKIYNENCLNLINDIQEKIDKFYDLYDIDKDFYKKNEYIKIINEIIEMKKSFIHISSEIIYNARLINDTGIKEVVEYLYPCPELECFGYVAKNTNRCNSCNHFVCPYCREFLWKHEQYDKDKDELYDKNNKIKPDHSRKYIHIFNENSISEFNNFRKQHNLTPFISNDKGEYVISCIREIFENYQLIKTDSKPCPNCKNYISKNHGCNQMFCVNCHQCFDWITLQKLDRRFVHNALLAKYLENIGQKMDFSNIRCDTLGDEFLPLLKNTIGNFDDKLAQNIKTYFRKHNEIKDNVYNNNTRSLNDQIINILKKFIIENHHYCVFDMDYVKDKVQQNAWLNRKNKEMREQLYCIYDETYGKNILFEYYQTLAQGMNDTFLSIQNYLLNINNIMNKKSKVKSKSKSKFENSNDIKIQEYIDKIRKLNDYLIKWYDEMKNIINQTISILEPKYNLIDLNDFR